jgi:hypothetical protein
LTDHPADDNGLEAVSCPTVALCVAGGPDDALYTYAAPVGAVWNHIDWGVFFSGVAGSVAGVACASESACNAVDNAGNVLSSSDPTTAWQIAAVDTHPLTAVACPSASLCVAVDSAGDVLTSESPAGRAAAWATASVDPGHSLTSVACPSVDLCVAVDTAGNVLASADPAGGASVWSTAPVDPGRSLSSISCPAVTLCVASTPTGTWPIRPIPPAEPAPGPSRR